MEVFICKKCAMPQKRLKNADLDSAVLFVVFHMPPGIYLPLLSTASLTALSSTDHAFLQIA